MQELLRILEKYWGYDQFRPLQAEAMRAVVEGRDSAVVLPTGGGKSLCFQAPAVQMPGLAVVVSPLISLMTDQVRALADCGVPAACINSTMGPDEKRRVADEIRAGRLKLLYLSPERLTTERTLDFLAQCQLSFFAIDEAHCISEWGHDFRPEYRTLRLLKERFPGIGVHAYTATATPRVRLDIVRELGLKNAEVLVGSIDRPKLIYRVVRRKNLLQQVCDVVDRHRDDAGIIYAIRRADVDELAASLRALGYNALPYHAGMSDEDRHRHQDAFLNDRARIIVATVAFGMGIDKSDVRYVIHAGAPKSLENYQQESGRAGRDGLEAECWLLWSPADFQTWRKLQGDLPEHAFEIAMKVLNSMDGFCSGVNCRHQAIALYFGQQLPSENCGACDVCLAELDLVDDALVLAQKILSCVVRLDGRFGGEYTTQILTASRDERIAQNGHDRLSTFGLLSDHDQKSVRGWIDQLAGQGMLERVGEYRVLQVTDRGRQVLAGALMPRLLRPASGTRKQSRAERSSWAGVDRELFDTLRGWRREIADDRGLAPFMVFSDATLRELARVRPASADRLCEIRGIGQKKQAEYGLAVIELIKAHDRERGVVREPTLSYDEDLPMKRPKHSQEDRRAAKSSD
ncbi:MAG: DNA helicase RecQ [Pirellulales bacterium]|nr:DNA helicase RecQ [Pirellulales bacterium]